MGDKGWCEYGGLLKSCKSLKNWDVNVSPWSVINLDPEPFRVMICVTYTMAQVSARWSGIGKASTYLEKWFINVSKNLFFAG
jgi:hypothetical protein